MVEVLALGLRRTLVQGQVEGGEGQALLRVLGGLGAEGLQGRLEGETGWVWAEERDGEVRRYRVRAVGLSGLLVGGQGG